MVLIGGRLYQCSTTGEGSCATLVRCSVVFVAHRCKWKGIKMHVCLFSAVLVHFLHYSPPFQGSSSSNKIPSKNAQHWNHKTAAKHSQKIAHHLHCIIASRITFTTHGTNVKQALADCTHIVPCICNINTTCKKKKSFSMIKQVCSFLISSLLPPRGCVAKCSSITVSDFSSRATFMYEQFPELMNMLWQRMLKDNKKNWRRVYKVLEGGWSVWYMSADVVFKLQGIIAYTANNTKLKGFYFLFIF